jgi:hypothetical protein
VRRGTSFLSDREFIPVQNFIKWALVQYRGTILISVRNLSRLQEFEKRKRRESGFITNYKFILVAGVKAKTVTSLFTLLTVLGVAIVLLVIQPQF